MSEQETGTTAGNRGWRCPGDEMMAAYVEGRLDERGQARIQGHVASCEYCRKHAAALVRMAAEAPPDVSPALIANAAALVNQGTAAKPRHTWQWAAVASTAAVVSILAVAPMLRNVRTPASAPSEVASSAPPPTQYEPSGVRHVPAGALRPEMEFPLEGASVAPQGLEFRWTAIGASATTRCSF